MENEKTNQSEHQSKPIEELTFTDDGMFQAVLHKNWKSVLLLIIVQKEYALMCILKIQIK